MQHHIFIVVLIFITLVLGWYWMQQHIFMLVLGLVLIFISLVQGLILTATSYFSTCTRSGTDFYHTGTECNIIYLYWYLWWQEWSVIGRMPFRMKTTLVGFWDGWLYFTSGQRDRGPHDPSPKRVVGSTWRTKLHL